MDRNNVQERNPGKIRLQVFMSRCGIGSRRYCERLILDGRVKVNGITVTELGTRVSEEDSVILDNEKIFSIEKRIYIAVNKPRGYLCANYDRFKRPLVIDLFEGKYGKSGKGRVFHVGRLDMESSGLIFYTNDGYFSNVVMHPSSEIEKDYIVKTSDRIEKDLLERYKKGLRIEKSIYKLKKYRYISENRVLLTLIEGKNREIRRVFEYFGIRIISLERVRIGIVTLEGLKSGQYRPLRQSEINWFLERGGKVV